MARIDHSAHDEAADFHRLFRILAVFVTAGDNLVQLAGHPGIALLNDAVPKGMWTSGLVPGA
ncbi:MAG TPA: hypothetical protein VIQ05_01255 [Tardiphaga sp.]